MMRLQKKFKQLNKEKRCAFIAYITAGDPSLKLTKQLIFELEAQGVDIIEIGVPFSDPLADGPVIQAASARALEKNIALVDILRLIKSIRAKVTIPLCLMTYYNPIYRFGLKRFAESANNAGVDGIIVPDLPPEEAKEFISSLRKYKIDTIFFVSPMSSVKRIKLAAKVSSGFIYYVSLTGVTGARRDLPADLKRNISLIRKYTTKPVCVGFGISKPDHVKRLSSICDGVIVGSAIVNKVSQNINNKKSVKIVGRFVRNLVKSI